MKMSLRRRALILVLIGGAALSVVRPATAQPLTNTQLYLFCKSVLIDGNGGPPQNTVDANYCNGYTTGFIQAMGVAGAYNSQLFCSPAASTFMMAKMYVDFIDKNPQLLSEDPATSFTKFLINSFPCRANPK